MFGQNGARQDWAGICAVILAAGLSSGWAGAILIASFRGTPIGEQSVNLLSTLGGAMAGAIATYLGSMIRQAQRLAGREYQSERAAEVSEATVKLRNGTERTP